MMVAMKVILVLCIWNVGLFEAAPSDSTTTDSLIPCTNDSLCRCEPERCTISDWEVCTTKYRDGTWIYTYPAKVEQVPYEDCQMVSKTVCHEKMIYCLRY